MTSIANGELGSSVRSKLNSSLTVTDAFTVSSGNVGIGTSPTAGFKLDVSGNATIGSDAGVGALTVRSMPVAVNQLATTARFGANSDSYDFRIINAITSVGDSYVRLAGPTNYNSYMAFENAGSEGMRITAAGNVGIGTTSPNAASIVDAQSTTKGVRFPNMTTTQKAAIANVAGNVVFDTTLGKLCVNNGSAWQTITSV